MTTALAGRIPVVQQVRATTSQRSSSWTGLLAHATVVAGVAASLLVENPTLTLAIGGLTVFPLYLWLCWREGRRAPLYVSPLSFMFFWNGIGLGLSAVYMASQISHGEYFNFSTMQLRPSDLACGYVLYLVGMASMHAGMELLRPHPGEVPYGGDLPFNYPLKTIFGGLTIGLFYLFRQSWFSFLGAIASPISRMATASLCLLALLPCSYLGLKRHVHRGLLVICTFMLVVANMKSGSKAYIMFSFFPLVWAMIARKELRRSLAYLAIVLTLLYTGLVAPTMIEIRLQKSRGIASDYGVIWKAAEDASPLLSGDWAMAPYWEQLEAYLARMFDAQSVSLLVQEVSLHGFQYGGTMKYAAYAFIPRLLWPEKPSVSRGAWFTAYIGFSPREAESTTSTGMTAVGELYWNFGVPGVMVGMCMIGMAFGQLWKMAGANPISSPLRMLLYVQLTLGMPDMAEAVSVFAGAICSMIIFGSLFFLLQKSTRQHSMFV
jgi:hypothetical protein